MQRVPAGVKGRTVEPERLAGAAWSVSPAVIVIEHARRSSTSVQTDVCDDGWWWFEGRREGIDGLTCRRGKRHAGSDRAALPETILGFFDSFSQERTWCFYPGPALVDPNSLLGPLLKYDRRPLA